MYYRHTGGVADTFRRLSLVPLSGPTFRRCRIHSMLQAAVLLSLLRRTLRRRSTILAPGQHLRSPRSTRVSGLLRGGLTLAATRPPLATG